MEKQVIFGFNEEYESIFVSFRGSEKHTKLDSKYQGVANNTISGDNYSSRKWVL